MRQLNVKSTSKNKRKRNTTVWKRPFFKPVVLSAVFGLVAAGMTYSVKSGLTNLAGEKAGNAALKASTGAGFILKDVLVEGRENTPVDDLRAVVDLRLDQSILEIDPFRLRERIEALPWIATASVERQLPDIIHIRLNEHKPTAMWQHDGTFSLINKDGEVILTGGDDINVFSHLPLVVGHGAPKLADQMLAILKSEPDLYKRVKSVVRVSNRRWDVEMENGMFIRLPEELPEKAWARLALYSKENELFQTDLTSVDLRLPDRILVKFGNTETIRKPLMGQDT